MDRAELLSLSIFILQQLAFHRLLFFKKIHNDVCKETEAGFIIVYFAVIYIKCLYTYIPYIVCNERQAFFISGDTKRYKLWSYQNVCEALIYLLDNIYIRFGTKLYRQIVGIQMGTNCAPLEADFVFILL